MALISLQKLLGARSGKGLDELVRHAREMTDLASVLRAVLPPDARSHLVAANLRAEGELVVVCSSPS